jgi:hypothetical protein
MDRDDPYGLKVQFPDKSEYEISCYSFEGKLLYNDAFPVLFLNPSDFKFPEKKENLK